MGGQEFTLVHRYSVLSVMFQVVMGNLVSSTHESFTHILIKRGNLNLLHHCTLKSYLLFLHTYCSILFGPRKPIINTIKESKHICN